MTTGEQILKELGSIKEILESIEPANVIHEDMCYLQDVLLTRIIHVTGHVEKLQRIGSI